MQTTYTDEKKWQTAANIVDCLQFISSNQGTTIEDLIKKLGECFPEDFPIKGVRLSIVYKAYLTPFIYKILVLRSQPQESLLMLEDSPLMAIKNTVVDIINNDKNPVLEPNADKELSSLLGCAGLVIVPMRVDHKRIIGVFILESTLNEEVLTRDDQIIMDSISDRLALLMQSINPQRRSNIIQTLIAESTENATSFQHESCILRTVIDSLVGWDDDNKNGKNFKSWFSKEELSIVLHHPLYNDKVYLACYEGYLVESFRNNSVIKKDELHTLLGSDFDKLLRTKDIIICNNESEVKKQGLPFGYRSYAIVPMRILDRMIGLFVLRNRYSNAAYQDEIALLERIATFAATTLRDFCDNRFTQQRREFRNKFFRDQRLVCYEDLYASCVDILTDNFGEIDFVVLSLDRASSELQNIYISKTEIDVNYELKRDIEHYIYETDKTINHGGSENTDNSESAPMTSDKKFSIFSTHAESGRVTNIILIGSNTLLDKSTTDFLRDLFDIISFKQVLDSNKHRLIEMTNFSKSVADSDFTNDKFVDKIYELFLRSMMSIISLDNIYIAILGIDHNIHFPLFIRKTSNGLDVIKVNSRSFDVESRAPARTEWILIHKQPIIIRSKEESIQWYRSKGDSEQIGDPFASWVGVPILRKGDAIGVISAFHPTVDYLYSQEDVLCLENIAAQLSPIIQENRLTNTQRKILYLYDSKGQRAIVWLAWRNLIRYAIYAFGSDKLKNICNYSVYVQTDLRDSNGFRP